MNMLQGFQTFQISTPKVAPNKLLFDNITYGNIKQYCLIIFLQASCHSVNTSPGSLQCLIHFTCFCRQQHSETGILATVLHQCLWHAVNQFELEQSHKIAFTSEQVILKVLFSRKRHQREKIHPPIIIQTLFNNDKIMIVLHMLLSTTLNLKFSCNRIFVSVI